MMLMVPLMIFQVSLVVGGALFIQTLLSRTENLFSGLCLPVSTFLFSLFAVFQNGNTQIRTIQMNGKIYKRYLETNYTMAQWYEPVLYFLLFNVPTFVFAGVYMIERKKKKKQRARKQDMIHNL